MSKYIIEGNLNFQEELYKLLDEDSDNEDELCQITGLPLKDKYVLLECNHHFNYDALYKEIYKQKYEFKTYQINALTKKEQQKLNNSKLDYFIKCPYCRNIQFTILPYYKELGLKELYGINSLYKRQDKQEQYNTNDPQYGDKNYTFISYYGVTFKYGKCCKINGNDIFGYNCQVKYVAPIPNTKLDYCSFHYIEELKIYKMHERKRIMNIKLLIKKEKQDKINEKKKLLEDKKKLLEDKNYERAEKGLTPLKRLPIIKKKFENIVEQQNQSIQTYISEEEMTCKEILKSGPNKGKSCGCKKIETNGLCKRHSPKELSNKKLSDKDLNNNELNVYKNVL